ncbi:SpoIID/LytB domain-containing protein [Phycisphaera mikurensis]|nr:SpoIID/LytB domain-containing protein [Phycisphaera mikurensis]MBB6443285.1 stage II sporulation protein D [Phycisphaera mikurensis]
MRSVWLVLALAASAGLAAGQGAGRVAADVEALLRPRPGVEGPPLGQVHAEPRIRVRVRAGVDRVTLGEAGARVALRGGGPTGPGSLLPGPVVLRAGAGFFVSEDATGARLRWPVARLSAAAGSAGAPLALDGEPHPGSLTLALRSGEPRMDAIELVGLESYLPGVLDRELYASWSPEAFRAQAIAARSYAIWEVELTRRAAGGDPGFDLENTTASQAYGGVAKNPKAADGVAATRGVVLAYGGRVLPAFYCSAVGGPGADAAQTFPGRAPDLAPLRGSDHGGRDAASPRFGWGPVTRDRRELARRIAAWGAANQNPVAGLRVLEAIEPAATNFVGRLAAYRLRDASGAAFLLRADELRHAANAAAPGLPAAAGDDRLFSGDFAVRRGGEAFTFSRGRGFGHGVGLSQWGAQGMAARGFAHPAILAAYYPGATLARAYR